MRNTFVKLFEIMTPKERKRFFVLVALTFGMTAVEAATVFSILPFLQLLSNPGLIEESQVFSWVYTTFGFTSVQSFTVWAGVAIFLTTLIGLIVKMLTIWLTTRFALMRSYSLSARLLTGYLHQPYEWFLSKHSSELGNAVLSEVDQVVSRSLLPAMRLIPELFLVVILAVALSFMEPGVAIGAVILLGGCYVLIFMFVRNVLLRLGTTRLTQNRARFHTVQEATGGVRELKIMGLEAGFLNRFRSAAFSMAKVQTTSQVISALPRYILEGVAFGGMILLILALIIRENGDISALVPTLGIIAVVGLRLIPALQQVYSRVSSLRESYPTLVRIHRDLINIPRPAKKAAPDAPTPLTHSLTIEEAHYSYPGAATPALNGVSLTFPAKAMIGIVGGSGAGKTTLVDMILALLHPNSGRLLIDGTPLTSENSHSWQKTLGYVPQTIFLSDGTLAENIAFGQPADKIDRAAVERAAKAAALHDFVTGELPKGYDTPIGERGTRLSGGQRQRVGIARALYHDPSTLILDEATSALDTLTEMAVIDAVKSQAGQRTVIMIAHRLSTIRDCDIVFLMRNGQVAGSGSYNDLIATDDEFRKMADHQAVS